MPTTKNQIVSKNTVFKPISTIVPGVSNLNDSFVDSMCKPLWLFPHQNFYVIFYISARLAHVLGVIVAVFVRDSFYTERTQPK